MRCNKSKILSCVILLLIFACSETNKNNNETGKAENQVIDSSKVELIIERGAFHYDKFVLKDTIITFYPSSKSTGIRFDKYNHISEQKISKKKRTEFINYIIDNGIFDLNDTYSNETTCSSSLIITFKFGNQTKKIISEDFDRGCPDLLKFIEKQIILLHNKDLVRIILPG